MFPTVKLRAVSTRNSATACRLLTLDTFMSWVSHRHRPVTMAMMSQVTTSVAEMGMPPKMGMVK